MKLYPITFDTHGSLAIVGRPRGGDWLEDDLRNLAERGVSVLVSALERSEEHELGLELEASTAERVGLVHIRIPIPDRSVPVRSDMKVAIARIVKYLDEGAQVAVHCRMGIGRSSLICGTVLVSKGVNWKTAWALIREARGIDLPDTPEQYDWLGHFATDL